MRIFLSIIGMVCATTAFGDTVVSTRIIRPQTVITADAITVKSATIAGTYSTISQLVGQEARTAIYPGRPIRIGDVGMPALIDRNQIVTLLYQRNGLSILTEARALSRAAAGETVRVMNMSSRTTVSGMVQANGTVRVLQ